MPLRRGVAEPIPYTVQLGHAAALGWAVLWVFVGLRGGQAPWGGVVAVVGGLMTCLVLVARLRSARAWLLLQLFTVILLCCCVAALSTEPNDGGSGAAGGGVGGGAQVGAGEAPGPEAGDENAAVVLVTVALQLVALVALGRRDSRHWHRVDPQGWRTLFDR
ncbi:MAG: hypothetical protein GEV08_12990 [Acidimicrobiia bacterium]|nr:hypothetical protein [Acidimicrobiia bacterium]